MISRRKMIRCTSHACIIAALQASDIRHSPVRSEVRRSSPMRSTPGIPLYLHAQLPFAPRRACTSLSTLHLTHTHTLIARYRCTLDFKEHQTRCTNIRDGTTDSLVFPKCTFGAKYRSRHSTPSSRAICETISSSLPDEKSITGRLG